MPFLAKNGLEGVDDGKLRKAIKTIRGRARTFVEAADMMDYYFRDPPRIDDAAAQKHLVKGAVPILRGFRDAIADAPWEEKALEEKAHAWLAASAVQIKDLGQPARVALTGRTASPGLYEVLVVVGRETSLKRLDVAIARADAAS
jgi:glutamyl-tRNA synthetase